MNELERLANDPRKLTRVNKIKLRQFDEQVNAVTSSTMNMNQSRASAKYEKRLLSASLWLTTVIYLVEPRLISARMEWPTSHVVTDGLSSWSLSTEAMILVY